MFFNTRSLTSVALFSTLALQACAHPSPIELKPISGPSTLRPGRPLRRNGGPPPLELVPISDPGVLTHGRSLKREVPGNEVFDPANQANFFWGAYAGDTIYVANLTLENPGDDEYILPLQNFAKRVKALNCGDDNIPMAIEFSDKESFDHAKAMWSWVDEKDINHFTLVTEPNQCHDGDNRSPYLVESIQFDDANLKAIVKADEKEWSEMAHTFRLQVNHEFVEPSTADVTHPHLTRRGKEGKPFDITTSFNGELFKFGNDSGETTGLELTANAEVALRGKIIADFDIDVGFFKIKSAKLTIRPQDVSVDFLLSLNAAGKLGKKFEYTAAEIEIPISGFSIFKVLEIGPQVNMGINFASSAIEGHASIKAGARAKINNAAFVDVNMADGHDNKIEGWKPDTEPIAPEISAEIGANVRAWAEIAVQFEASAFDKWGFEAGIAAQLPYFQAEISAKTSSSGVCDGNKIVGVEAKAEVGLNVNLNAGKINEAPMFEQVLYDTAWPLFSTCMGLGSKEVETKLPDSPLPPVRTTKSNTSDNSPPTSKAASGTPAPTSNSPVPSTNTPSQTTPMATTTTMPPGVPPPIATASKGYPVVSANSTLPKIRWMKRRDVTLN
ncbi:hypothetical protein BDV95DRAFT_602381 [Massariosphaeria phaeospora]|uniref:Uncharacterized protein n=1 Tax=Massariosphaeria phaeospora TaxID=100035 RepID=A0A7C8ICR4_9PLEO|nr:hypothetical protein BDV95DRAFT_602381 [Massariosphaeria phaeospora]